LVLAVAAPGSAYAEPGAASAGARNPSGGAAGGFIEVLFDGQPVEFPDQRPVVVDDRTLVPVRGVFETLGFVVGWDDAEQQATLTGNKFVVVITVGSYDFTTNGERLELDVPAQLINGRVMLPIRAVLESVGYYVGWDDATQTVLITSEPAAVTAAGEYALYDAYLEAKLISIREEEIKYWAESEHDGIQSKLIGKKLLDLNGDGTRELYFEAECGYDYYFGFCTVWNGAVVELTVEIGGPGDGGTTMSTAYSGELREHVLNVSYYGILGFMEDHQGGMYNVYNNFYRLDGGQLIPLDEVWFSIACFNFYNVPGACEDDDKDYKIGDDVADVSAYGQVIGKYSAPIDKTLMLKDTEDGRRYDQFHLIDWH